ncbi:LacI family DNA-binding transcriptional regulator [Paenibacillus sp. NRS-1760]|uniref:LacI family DNA-binding transcriptional regulator n=1 Tax=Paenibacillus sp. NRS-1760 TaxID=3233902 RepID=UPI003D275FAC
MAKAAQVSVATVSYVLNNVSNQTIPEETKCRVLDAAKQLNYVPNLAARSLVKQKSGLIGILINRAENEGFWKQFRYSQFINRLERLLSDHGYHVVLFSLDASSPNLDIISERKLDGVFVVDVKEENFHLISSHFSTGVPLIVVDSMIEDPLFYKVNYDYADAFTHAFASLIQPKESFLIIDSFNNADLVNHICTLSGIGRDQIHVVDEERDLKAFLEHNSDRTGIILNEFVAISAAKYVHPTSLTVICTAGCAEIAPASASKISFGDHKPEESFHLMMQLLKDPKSGPVNKYVLVKADK